jgi:hypothetical protein
MPPKNVSKRSNGLLKSCIEEYAKTGLATSTDCVEHAKLRLQLANIHTPYYTQANIVPLAYPRPSSTLAFQTSFTKSVIN